MGSGLASLIRLRRWTLDEERQRLAPLMRALQELQEKLAGLDAEIDRERESAANDEVAFAYASYAGRAMVRRAAAVDAIARAEAAATAQRQVVLLCHREMRSAELAEQARFEKLAREARRREQIAVDELALLTRDNG